jgi:uncharacterized membrane protein (UPF0127 family)
MFVLLIQLLLAITAGCENTPAATNSASPGVEKLVIGGETFSLDLAADDQSREVGLKHRDNIPDHGGMLFVFPDDKVGIQSFWMHECLIDMDLIFLDPHGTITATHRMKARPLRQANETEDQYRERMRQEEYPSGYPAQFAVELQAGSLDRLHLHVDDRIKLDVERLKAMAR